MTVSRNRQEERSATTQRRILDAAFEALFEVGFAGTTTSEVCRRAGVSRGTLLHHYPSTSELLTAAAEDIFMRRLEAYRAAFDAMPKGRARGGEAVRLLWTILSGPTYYAWLEILVASRTDELLRQGVQRVMQTFGAAVDESYAAMFPPPPDAAFDTSLVPAIVFPLLNGLAVDRIHADAGRVDEIVTTVCHLADWAEGMVYPS